MPLPIPVIPFEGQAAGKIISSGPMPDAIPIHADKSRSAREDKRPLPMPDALLKCTGVLGTIVVPHGAAGIDTVTRKTLTVQRTGIFHPPLAVIGAVLKPADEFNP